MADEVAAQVDYDDTTFEQFHDQMEDLISDRNLIGRLNHSTSQIATLITLLNETLDVGEVDFAPGYINLAEKSLEKTARYTAEYKQHFDKIHKFLTGHQNYYDTLLYRLKTRATGLGMDRIQETENETYHRDTSVEQEDVLSLTSDHITHEQELQGPQGPEGDHEDPEAEFWPRITSSETPEQELDDAEATATTYVTTPNTGPTTRTLKRKRSQPRSAEEISPRELSYFGTSHEPRRQSEQPYFGNPSPMDGETDQRRSRHHTNSLMNHLDIRRQQPSHQGTTMTRQQNFNGSKRNRQHPPTNQQQVRAATSSPINTPDAQQQLSNQDQTPTRQRNNIIKSKLAKIPKSDRAPRAIDDEKIHNLTEVISLLELGGRRLPDELHGTLEYFRTEKGMKSLTSGVKGGSRCAVARLHKSSDLFGNDENDTCWYCLKYQKLCIKVTPDGRRLPAESRQGLSPADVGYWRRNISGL